MPPTLTGMAFTSLSFWLGGSISSGKLKEQIFSVIAKFLLNAALFPMVKALKLEQIITGVTQPGVCVCVSFINFNVLTVGWWGFFFNRPGLHEKTCA